MLEKQTVTQQFNQVLEKERYGQVNERNVNNSLYFLLFFKTFSWTLLLDIAQ